MRGKESPLSFTEVSARKRFARYILFFTLAFAFIFVCTYVVFLKNGKSFIWNIDGIRQHFAALLYLRKYYREVAAAVFHGSLNLPMFDFSLGMGEDIITTLNFYGLGDPLTLFSVFVPEGKMEIFYHILVVFRMYLAGVSFSCYCMTRRRDWNAVFLGGLIYAFSGYVLHVAVKHPFFVTPMILLPLTLAGIDRVVEKKKQGVLIFGMFLTAVNGFYFLYMNTVFLCIYAVIRILHYNAGENMVWERIRTKERGAYVRSVLCCAARSVAAAGKGIFLAGALLCPTVYAYMNSTRSGSAVDAGNLFFYSGKKYLVIFSKIIGTPRITWDYLGMASLILPAIVILFMAGRRKFTVLKVNLMIWSILMLVPFGGYAMNGFSYVSGRFLYLVTFLYAYCAVSVLPDMLRMKKKEMAACGAAAAVYAVIVFVAPDSDELFGWFGFWMLLLTLVFLYVVSMRKLPIAQAMPVLFVLVAVNLIGCGWFLFSGRGQGYVQEFLDAGTAASTLNNSPETGVLSDGGTDFYRVGSPEKATENAAMATGVHGVSSYFSISNPNRIRYLMDVQNAGIYDSMFKIEGMDGRTFLNALASVRYYVVRAGKEKEVPYGYRRAGEFMRGGGKYVLYENECFLPLGITYDSYMRKQKTGQASGLLLQEMMMHTVILEEDAKVREVGIQEEWPESGLAEIPFTVEKTKHVKIKGDRVTVTGANASITISYADAPDGECYACLDHFQITQKNRMYCDITMKSENGKKVVRALTDKWNWYFGREKYAVNLGYQKAGWHSATIRFSSKGNFKLSDLHILVQSMDGYHQAVEERRAECMQNTVVGTNEVRGEISVSRPKILFLSIPYSTGWTALVDGKETELWKADTGYMALELPAGSHSISLAYRTPFSRVGLGISGLGLVWIIIGGIVSRNRNEDRDGEKEI